MKIMRLLTITDKYSFLVMYEEWRDKWKYFINERRIDEKVRKYIYMEITQRDFKHKKEHALFMDMV